jgi:hypothetical protein
MEQAIVDVGPVPDITLNDVSLVEQIYCRRYVADADGELTEEEAHVPLPEDVVAKMEELSGDMKGRVTVGVELASSVEFGFKAGAFCSIGVSCDSSEGTLEEVHSLLFPLAQKMVIEDHYHMSQVRDAMLPRDKQLGGACVPPVSEDFENTDRPKRPKKSNTGKAFRNR